MKEGDFGKFLRLLTHDLQNQLGAVDLNLQILPTLLADDDPAQATLAPFLARASLGSQDLIESLNDIQFFARAVSREDDGAPVEHTLTRCNLSAKVRDLSMILAKTANTREVSVTTQAPGDICATAESDAIRRAIKIAASEALRSLMPGSKLELIVTESPVPMIEIATSQEGLFEESRPTLAMFLAQEILRPSDARIVYGGRSLQILFRPA